MTLPSLARGETEGKKVKSVVQGHPDGPTCVLPVPLGDTGTEGPGSRPSIGTSGGSFYLFESFHLPSLEKCDTRTCLQGFLMRG